MRELVQRKAKPAVAPTRAQIAKQLRDEREAPQLKAKAVDVTLTAVREAANAVQEMAKGMPAGDVSVKAVETIESLGKVMAEFSAAIKLMAKNQAKEYVFTVHRNGSGRIETITARKR